MNTIHQDIAVVILVACAVIYDMYRDRKRSCGRESFDQLRPETGTHVRFGDLPQAKSSLRIRNYLRISRESYRGFRINLEDVEIRKDLGQAQLAFFVSREDQANPGVMHGGKSYLVADSVIAALVMANFPDAIPLTTNSATTYLAPCFVGRAYRIQAELAPDDPANPKLKSFTYRITGVDDGKVTMTGSMSYFPKVTKDLPEEVPEERVLHGFGGPYLRCSNGTLRPLYGGNFLDSFK